jgi:hypothetical protein
MTLRRYHVMCQHFYSTTFHGCASPSLSLPLPQGAHNVLLDVASEHPRLRHPLLSKDRRCASAHAVTGTDMRWQDGRRAWRVVGRWREREVVRGESIDREIDAALLTDSATPTQTSSEMCMAPPSGNWPKVLLSFFPPFPLSPFPFFFSFLFTSSL